MLGRKMMGKQHAGVKGEGGGGGGGGRLTRQHATGKKEYRKDVRRGGERGRRKWGKRYELTFTFPLLNISIPNQRKEWVEGYRKDVEEEEQMVVKRGK